MDKITFIEQHLNPFLENLGNEANKQVDNINHGGCCVYASIVGDNLKKFFPFLNVNIKVATDPWFFDSHKNIDDIRNKRQMRQITSVRGWQTVGKIDFGHVFIEICYENTISFLCDSTLVERNNNNIFFDNMFIYKGSFSIEEAKKFSNEEDFWNERFNREYITILEDFINLQFIDFYENIKNFL